jgi:hypothetical protein
MLMAVQVLAFPVYRDEIARFDQRVNDFQLFLTGMAGNMDVFQRSYTTSAPLLKAG